VALSDADTAVRATAAASLRELVVTLPAESALAAPLTGALAQPDPVVRATALDVLRALRLGTADAFAAALTDPDIAVRIEAVRGLVSLDATELLVRAATDASREVRVTVAKALAAPADSPPVASLVPAALARLTEDPDALVRAAAFTSLATTGYPDESASRALAACSDPAWQVRAGAATALSAAPPDLAIPALAQSLTDPNADVRKAAVLALTRHATKAEARTALATATTDSDADVRAYASRAL
jgi:HEAT repeat protein